MKTININQLSRHSTGHHSVVKTTFVDNDGEIKTGFYTPRAQDYSLESAKRVVASSVLMRLSLPDRVAEERLVLNDEGEVQGTLSIALPEYEPLQHASISELLQHNFAELLISLWRVKDNDVQPAHLGIKGSINRKDSLYLGKEIQLKSYQLDNFPLLEGRTYWPTTTFPLNFNLLKIHPAKDAFRELATHPSMRIQDGSISFQEQMFNALLKELLVFDTELLSRQLEEYLGKSFADEMMILLKNEYDEFYRVVVFYMGCQKNQADVSVMSFAQFLYNNPAAYWTCKEWAIKQNAVNKGFPLYNLEKMEQRYLQIYRDVQIISIQVMVNSTRNLIDELLTNVFPIEGDKLIEKMVLDAHNLKKSQHTQYYPENKLYPLYFLDSFIKEIQSCVENYYKLDQQKLTIKDNICFGENITTIIQSANDDLDFMLGEVKKSWQGRFRKILAAFHLGTVDTNTPEHFYKSEKPTMLPEVNRETNSGLSTFSIFSHLDSSPSNSHTPTALQASLLEGFAGFEHITKSTFRPG